MSLTVFAEGATSGFAIVSGKINLPRIGAWTADLVVATPTLMVGKIAVELSPSLTLHGTLAGGGLLENLFRGRFVGGGNGLRSLVRPKHYTAPSARVVLSDLLSDVGETLSTTADRDVLNTQFEHWTTMEMPAGKAIRCLLERASAAGDIAWRHLPDGTLWVGRETWPETTSTDFAEVAGSTPEVDVIGLSMRLPALVPGTTLGGRRIDHIEYRLDPGEVRATAWLQPENTGTSGARANVGPMFLDRPKGSFAALAAVRPTADFERLFRAKVLKQHTNLKRVDVQPDDPKLPPMSNIPLRIGVPGLDVTVAPGHRLAVGWEDGQPDRPMAALWEPGTQGTKPLKETFHAEVIELGGPVTPIKDGVVTGMGKDPYTGLPYWMLGNSSAIVGAKK